MDGWGRPIRVGTLSLPGRLGGLVSALGRVRKSLEALLEAERTQLPLWVVVAFGCGIAAWFALPDARAWVGVMTMGFGLTAAGSAAGGRIGNLSMGIGLALALGCGWIWLRSETVAHERIERVTIETFDAEVTKVEPLVARLRNSSANAVSSVSPGACVLLEFQWPSER